jgi:hypothetical protein
MNFRQASLDEIFVKIRWFVPIETLRGRMLPNRSVL